MMQHERVLELAILAQEMLETATDFALLLLVALRVQLLAKPQHFARHHRVIVRLPVRRRVAGYLQVPRAVRQAETDTTHSHAMCQTDTTRRHAKRVGRTRQRCAWSCHCERAADTDRRRQTRVCSRHGVRSLLFRPLEEEES